MLWVNLHKHIPWNQLRIICHSIIEYKILSSKAVAIEAKNISGVAVFVFDEELPKVTSFLCREQNRRKMNEARVEEK